MLLIVRRVSTYETNFLNFLFYNFRYNLGDYNGEIMSEVMAQRQPVKPTYAIPIIPITNSSQFKHQEAVDVKEFKVNKVIQSFVIIVADNGVVFYH